MKLLVCGGRDYSDAQQLAEVLDRIHEKRGITMIIQGGAAGADKMASQWAGERGIHYASVPANWERHGKSAGPKRNAAMLSLMPDGVVAFPGGRGTESMVSLAKDSGIKVMEVK